MRTNSLKPRLQQERRWWRKLRGFLRFWISSWILSLGCNRFVLPCSLPQQAEGGGRDRAGHHRTYLRSNVPILTSFHWRLAFLSSNTSLSWFILNLRSFSELHRRKTSSKTNYNNRRIKPGLERANSHDLATWTNLDLHGLKTDHHFLKCCHVKSWHIT